MMKVDVPSAFSKSLSLHGISTISAASSIFFELSMVLMFVIRLWSCVRLRGRGGTTGFGGLTMTFCGIDSSELEESSWPAVVKFTLLCEFCIPFLRLMIPAALLGLMYLPAFSPLLLFCEEIVGRNNPPLETGSLWSESL